MSTTIDIADAAVVLLVSSGAAYLIGYYTRGVERRSATAHRRSRDLELRHRAADPDEDEPDTIGTTTGDGDLADEVVNRGRFAWRAAPGWQPVAAVPPPPRAVMSPDWIAAITGSQVDEAFAGMTAGLREDPDADLLIFAEVSGALVQPTREWLALGRPGATYVPPPVPRRETVLAGVALVHAAAVRPTGSVEPVKPGPRPTTPPSVPAPKAVAR